MNTCTRTERQMLMLIGVYVRIADSFPTPLTFKVMELN